MLERTHEPVRITIRTATLLVAGISLAIDLLSEVDWRAALIRALTSLALLLGGTELARSKVVPTAGLEDLAVLEQKLERKAASRRSSGRSGAGGGKSTGQRARK